MINGFKTANEFANEWGVTVRQVQILCASGKIEGATKFGKSWAIPENTQKPIDQREKSGKYKNWRKKRER